MSDIELQVAGMSCGGCSSRLKRVLEAAAGVRSARVVLATRQVAITYDEACIDAGGIRSLIEGAGFKVVA